MIYKMEGAMKVLNKLFAGAIAGSLIATSLVGADDQKKAAHATHDQVEMSKTVKTLINEGLEHNDAVFFMAAGKLMNMIGPVSIRKPAAMDKDPEALTDADLWSVADTFAKAAEIAGANSEMGQMATSLADENRQEANAEGCLGFTHYHVIWWYDRYGNYHERIVWHYC